MKAAILAALLLEGLRLTTAHAGEAPDRLRDQAARQAEIYNSVGTAVPEGYVIGRSLLSYAYTLSPQFRHSLAKLGPAERWLDIGAGEGHAVLDYHTARYDILLRGPGGEARAGKARAVAMSIEDRRTARWHDVAASLGDRQIQYLFGKRLREYAPEELGRFRLITDVLGGFSYTRYPTRFLENTLGALEVGGDFYTLLQDVQPENGGTRPHYAGAPFLTEIVRHDGAEMKVCPWLKRISCVEVTCEYRADSSPPSEAYRIRKVCEAVTVPPLEPVHFEAGTPPERRFRLSAP